MRFICAVSNDGYMCKGSEDDMSWTPKIDKKIFQLISSLDTGICFVSSKTHENMPKHLAGRTLLPISRKGLSLQLAAKLLPNSIILGGPSLLKTAYQLGVVTELIVNLINISLAPFVKNHEACSFPFEELAPILSNKIISIEFGEITTSIYRSIN